MNPTLPHSWRTSSHTQSYQCVEVGRTDDGDAAVRDSKNRSAGYFTVTARQWTLFVDNVCTGCFDR